MEEKEICSFVSNGEADEFSSPCPSLSGDLNRDFLDSILCYSGSKLVLSGLKDTEVQDEYLIFLNAGGPDVHGRDSRTHCNGDSFFQGGDVMTTYEAINDAGDYPLLYQSVRYGNFSYKFEGLVAGDYLVDLHFAEIIYTSGPKGIRVFDVFVQAEKVLSEFDIFSVVGANRPLRITDIRIAVLRDGMLDVRFQEIRGSPVVCGIGIRRAPKQGSAQDSEYVICTNCATEIPVSPAQMKGRHKRLTAKLEKKIQELSSQCQSKSDECHEVWMLLDSKNEQLQKLSMEFHDKLMHNDTLEGAMKKHMEELRVATEMYESDKNKWAAAVYDLERKVKVMKEEQKQLSSDAHQCADSIPNLSKMIAAVQTLVAQWDELKMKYNDELLKRKKLYNQLQELKGNIRVFCRCRPLSKEEVSSDCSMIVDFESAKDGELGVISGGSAKKTFKFDRVFTPKDDQEDIYADASPLVTSVLDGYNVCILAYGQTGTGKTFTMEGTEKNRGVNYRTLEELFKIAEERKETFTYDISVSVLEVYNEQIRDLLATSPSSKKLEVRQAPEGSYHVPGMVEAAVTNIKEVWDVLQAGSRARAVGSNNVNEHSSRSHCMLCVIVKSKNLMSGDCTKSKLWLVDLAGSERVAKTDAQGERLKEAQNINKSLSALGDVISALAAKNSHIPFRNSKLTHLLQDSLGGDAKTLMFVQISPSERDLGETLCSLNFASRVRGIELGPAKKHIDTGEFQKAKQLLEKVRQELRLKEESLRKLEETCQNSENKNKGKDQLCKELLEKNKALETQQWELSERLNGKEETLLNLQIKVKELEAKLKEQQHAESRALQQKVKDLLEDKLREQRQFEHKIKELELKLREKERPNSMLFVQPAEATPVQLTMVSRGNDTELMSEAEPHILRSSNSINQQPVAQGSSVLLRGVESLHEIKRKRELQSGTTAELENYMALPAATMIEKKALASGTSRVRKLDTSKAFGRLAKGVSVQKTSVHRKSIREQQVPGVKEREKIRGWL